MLTPGSQFDLVVVGTGVVGLAVAWELLGQGAEVAVVGPMPTADDGNASRAAGAMLSVFSEVEETDDDERVRVDVGERLASERRWDPWLAQVGAAASIDIEVSRGTWVVGRADEHGALDRIAQAAQQHGFVAEGHRRPDIPGLPPSSLIAAGVWLPDEGWVDSERLLRALTGAVAGHPRSHWRNAVVTSVGSDEAAAVVNGDGFTIRADQVVVAAGAVTPSLFDGRRASLGIPPIVAGQGAGLLVRGPDVPTHVMRTPNRAFSCGTHVVPRDDGLTYIGATNRFVPSAGVPRGALLSEIAVLTHEVSSDLDSRLFDAELVAVRTGQRPYTLDRLPLVGPTLDRRIMLATATNRSGVMLAPRIAELVADEVVEPGRHAHHPYRVDRPMIVTDLATVLARHSAPLIDALCEPDTRLPPGVRERLTALVQVALRSALGEGSPDSPQRSSVRAAWEEAPIAEALPAIVRLIESGQLARNDG